MQYDNTNRGVLFDNDRKEQDTHPDMTGTLNVNGVDHWFSAWWNDGQRGEFLTLSLGKPKEARQEQQAPRQEPRRGNRPSNSQGYRKPSQDAAKAFAPKRGTQGSGFDDFDSDLPPF